MLSNLSFAANDSVKIATVDMQKIESSALVFKDLQEKMKQTEEKVGRDFMTKKKEIEKEFKTLENKRAVLSGEELQKKAKTIEEKYQKLQLDEKIAWQALDMARMNAIQDVQVSMNKAVNSVSGEYDIIIPTGVALYIKKQKFDDLTSKVLNKLNSTLKTVNYEKSFTDAKSQLLKMANTHLK